MPPIIYSLPFSTAGQFHIKHSFREIKQFESREGIVQLVKSENRARKLRIIKSVRHSDRPRAPAEVRALSKRLLPNGDYHPNIIRCFTAELDPKTGCASMLFEYCVGGDLVSQVEVRPATPMFALHIMVSIGDALAFLHRGLFYNRYSDSYEEVLNAEPLVHGDIKDDNVFLRFPGRTGGNLPDVVMVDFGLGALESETRPGVACVEFISPECIEESVMYLTGKTDMYSFGVMMEGILNRASNGWELRASPRVLTIDVSYVGLGFTNFLGNVWNTDMKKEVTFQGLVETAC
jgi:serine/threonine protein kinase